MGNCLENGRENVIENISCEFIVLFGGCKDGMERIGLGDIERINKLYLW